MSRRTIIIFTVIGVIALNAIIRFAFPALFESPVVSVKAEPVFSVGSDGLHLGPGEGHGFIITNSMLMSVVVTIVLTVLSLIATRRMSLIPRGFQNFVELVVDGMYNTLGGVDRKYIARFWPLVGTIFFYVLFSNWLALVPGVLSVGYRISEAELHHTAAVHSAPGTTTTGDKLASAGEAISVTTAGEAASEELVLVPYFRSPSADLNNTLMLGLVAFFFIEFWGFKQLGLGYLKKFWPIKEFGSVGAVVGPLEFISEFVRIVSFAFRLFGNIFAGEVILLVMLFLLPLLPLPFLGLETFVGFIQAFVFAILVMAFTSLATQSHSHDEHGPEHAELGGELRQSPAAH